MLDEYLNSPIWKEHADEVNLRSDLLVTDRAFDMLGDIRDKKILDGGCGKPQYLTSSLI